MDADAPDKPGSVVTQQHVTPEKLQLARQLRQEMTAAESLLWRHLRGGRLRGLRFRRQQAIDGFVADFYCHPARLVVEVDGPVHARQQEYDSERDAILGAHGLTVLRLTNHEVLADLCGCLERIGDACFR